MAPPLPDEQAVGPPVERADLLARLRAPSWVNTLHMVTSWQRWTPPASTRSQRPDSSSATRWSTATRALAQATSTV